jgi:hypothetical protein
VDVPASDPPATWLPVAREARYRMAGRIRPLLFWIGRDDVGFARAAWRTGGSTRGYELLIGTDPRRAPRQLNRWGYVSEVDGETGGAVMAFMSRSDEDTLDQVEANGQAGGDFKVIRSRTGPGRSTWQVSSLQTSGRPTIHDLDALLAQVRARPAGGAAHERVVTGDTRPGFLTALVDLIDLTVAEPGSPASRDAAWQRRRVTYVFAQKLHELRIRSLSASDRPAPAAKPRPDRPGWKAARLVRTTFEILTPATGSRTEFEMIYGTRGDLAGVPTYVTWQPRWWLKVELFLDQDGGTSSGPEGEADGEGASRFSPGR